MAARAKEGVFLMKIDRRSNCSAKGGFKRMDLVAVVGGVVVVAMLAILGLGKLKQNALRAHCRANLAQITTALKLYAEDNHGLFPDCSINNRHFYGVSWPWDMNTNLVDDLMLRGVHRRTFYCPANPGMNDDKHWDFASLARSPDRVLGYGWLLCGSLEVPPAFWCRDLQGGNGKTPAEKELGMDATASMGGDYAAVQGILKDRSNHLKGTKPLGGNISFEDGHTGWRDFKDMQHRFSTGANVIWDF